MILHTPFIITSRLMAGLKIGDAYVSISYNNEYSSDGRTQYTIYIDMADGTQHLINDIRSGVGHHGLQEGMESLLAFLGAAADSYSYKQRTGRDSDNAKLFEPAVVEWAYQHSDEISMLGCELEEIPNLIEE